MAALHRSILWSINLGLCHRDRLPGRLRSQDRPQVGGGAAVAQVTVLINVLLGADHGLAEIKRYSPIGASQARRCFAPGTVGRRLLIQPETGLLVKTDPTTYRPTAETERHVTEPFQRCLSRVRTALAMTAMRFGLQRALRKIRQDFSRATPRSTGARGADRARLMVRSMGVSSPLGGRRLAVVTQSPAPM